MFTEPVKTREQLLEENANQKITITVLLEKCKSLESELNTHKENQEKNIDTSNMNPHSKSNLTVEEINIMLVGTGLESQGQAFKDMENTYNVNALFAMGVAMHESARGYKKANTYNYFGFRGNNGWMSFSSAYDCIQYFGKLINSRYSNRTTISAIQSKYCPDGSPWAQGVINHMNQLKEKINA
jgi:beta-N-acetylglucosaminidase